VVGAEFWSAAAGRFSATESEMPDDFTDLLEMADQRLRDQRTPSSEA
jgi:hypothetical protein